MAIWAQLNINADRIGSVSAQRLPHPHPVADDTWCTYRWTVDVELAAGEDIRSGTLEHRYGDGAWALIARILQAAGHTPPAPDDAPPDAFQPAAPPALARPR